MDNELEERSSLESIMEYVQLIWHWAWLLVLAALIAGGVAYYLTNQQPRMYQASTLVMVSGASGASVDSYTSLYLGQQLATTYAQTMLTGPVMQVVSEKLGFQVTAAGIDVKPVENTALINITVTDQNPEKAALIANTLVSVFSEQVLSDQTSRYTELKTSLESEIDGVNKQIDATQLKLTALIAKMDAQEVTSQVDLLTRSRYEETLSQYQQSRSYYIQTLQQVKLAEVQSTSSLIQKDPALPNYFPVQPQPMRSAMLAAIVGFMLAAGIVFLIGFLEDTIRDPEEITRKWGVPVLGIITRYASEEGSIITMSQPRAPVSEAFRALRTNLQFAGVNNPLRTILVTSASPEDGKTSVVANLATVLAQNDRDVVVIDGDLRKPRIHKVFQQSNRIGLTDYFIRTQDRLNGVVKKTNTKGLCVITSGSLPPNPSELLSSNKMMEVINVLSKHFNMLILDTPPLLAVTDALVLAPRVDGVILVMDPNKTKRGAIKHSIEQLQRVNANLLGVVLNNVKIKRTQYYYNRNYYYGKQYGKTDETQVIPEVTREIESSDSSESKA